MLGIRKLAEVLKGLDVPGWVTTALNEADKSDVIEGLVSDACAGVKLYIMIPAITIRIWFIPIRIPGFRIDIKG